MWIFIWKANEHRTAYSEVFMNFPDAWDAFKNQTVLQFPDVIMEVGTAVDDHNYGNQMLLSDFMDKGFALPKAA